MMVTSILLVLKVTLIQCMLGWSTMAKIDYKLLRSMVHDSQSFTQGLIIDKNGYIYESGGLYRQSTLRRICPDTGDVLQMKKLPNHFFAEGITIIDELIYMLTWRENTMLIFDKKTFDLIDMRSYKTYSGQGWGLAYDGKHLIASDGSNILTKFKLPEINKENKAQTLFGTWKFAPKLDKVEQIPVLYKGKPLQKINDLEYVDGRLFANIWYEDIIVEIDPNTGSVLSTIDMDTLWPHHERPRSADCLNGIAYNKTDKTFLVTGKLWPKYYQIKFNYERMDL